MAQILVERLIRMRDPRQWSLHLALYGFAVVFFCIKAGQAAEIGMQRVTSQQSPWTVIDENLEKSLDSYHKGDNDAAYLFVTTAYLDGFELLEDRLGEMDHDLMKAIEQSMGQLGKLMRQGAPVGVVDKQHEYVTSLIKQAREALGVQGGQNK